MSVQHARARPRPRSRACPATSGRKKRSSPRDPVEKAGRGRRCCHARGGVTCRRPPATGHRPDPAVILIPSLAVPGPCDQVGGEVAWRVINAAPSRHRLLPPTFSFPNPQAGKCAGEESGPGSETEPRGGSGRERTRRPQNRRSFLLHPARPCPISASFLPPPLPPLPPREIE